ncbi:MAG: shikimate kinase [Cyanobacteria bacterium P01_A01_bin.17]
MTSTSLNLKNVNVYLIGMMGAGKSTTGQLLAQKLSYQLFDSDTLITQLAGTSINQIFAEQGEDTFRKLETQVLSELSAYTRLVVSTGGGIVTQPSNWSHLQQGIVVWLDVPLEHLWKRIQADASRPLLQTERPYETLEQLMQRRRHLYAQADVHTVIKPDWTAEQVADQIIEGISKVIKVEDT